MTKRFTSFIVFLVVVIAVKAQQDPYYSQFMLNKLAYNPGTAGLRDATCVHVLAHRQWVGYKDQSLEYQTAGGQTLERRAVGPQSYFATATLPIRLLRGGVGIVFMSDALGYERNVAAKVSYAYHAKLSDVSRLQIGVDFGMLQKEFDGRYYNPRQPLDPLIPTGVTSGRIKDLGFGAHYHNADLANLNVGISATHLLGGTVTYNVGTATATTKVVPNYYLVAGAGFPIAGGLVDLQPNVWVKTIFSTTQIDLNCRAVYNQQFVGGLSYRDGGKNNLLDAFSLQLGYYVKPHFYLGYAYDIPITRGLAGGGTHEFFASYCFRIPRTETPPGYRIDPRHLGGY